MDVIAYIALVIAASALLLGSWTHARPRPRPRRRADRQLLRLIRHNRKANR